MARPQYKLKVNGVHVAYYNSASYAANMYFAHKRKRIADDAAPTVVELYFRPRGHTAWKLIPAYAAFTFS